MFVLDTNCVPGVQKQEAHGASGHTGTSNSSSPRLINQRWLPESFGDDSSTAEFSSLLQLQRYLIGGAEVVLALRHVLQPISLEGLEMLEAELLNQQILIQRDASFQTLSQQLNHEVSVWSWRAVRLGMHSKEMFFEVNLPNYILSKAAELLSVSKRSSESLLAARELQTPGSNSSLVLFRLQYLELFAAYLIGKYEKASSRYQRGLNLVLKTLCHRTAVLREQEAKNLCRVQLPTTLRSFMAHLKNFKENSAN